MTNIDLLSESQTNKPKEPTLCKRLGSHLPSWEKGNNTCQICKQDIYDYLIGVKYSYDKVQR